jgi:hypothetical protein
MYPIKTKLYNFLQKSYNRLYVPPALSLTSRFPVGTNVFEKDWDTLILLDTCRVDALQEVSEEYDFLPNKIDRILSVGSHSGEWIANTFTSRYDSLIADTTYITANAHAKYILEDRTTVETFQNIPAKTQWKTVSGDQLDHIEHLWPYGGEVGHVSPEIVTDRAIKISREDQSKKLIIHYSQPHEPYASEAKKGNRDELYEYESDPFDYLINGGDFDKVWMSYIKNLRHVLDSVDVLLDNMDAPKTIITADHGEAFGEFGFYAHQVCAPVPTVRYVPWAEVSANDTGNHIPDLQLPNSPSQDANDQLKALGYK